jgi:hypothetical protein
MSNRLEDIQTRQRRSRTRDLMFAAFIVLAAAISVSTVGSAMVSASTLANR